MKVVEIYTRNACLLSEVSIHANPKAYFYVAFLSKFKDDFRNIQMLLVGTNRNRYL